MKVGKFHSLKRLISAIIRYYFDTAILFFFAPHKESKDSRKTLLFVRMDAIGDFVLWSGTFGQVSKIFPKNEYKWILIGNQNWKDLAIELDFFEQIIAVDTVKFRKKLKYRAQIIRSLQYFDSDVVVHPTFSRDLGVSDSIVRVLRAPKKIGCIGDLSNITAWERAFSSTWYTHLFPSVNRQLMEIERNSEFVAQLGGTELEISPPRFNLADSEYSNLNLPNSDQPYFVIFPGASWVGRRWSFHSFVRTAVRLQSETGHLCIFCGSLDDRRIAEDDLQTLKISNPEFQFSNLMGETSLPELSLILQKAKLLVSNETSAVHIGAALGTPTVCILGGGHFGRFAPWVDKKGNFSKNPLCIYMEMPCFNCNWNCIYSHDLNGTVKCISDISVEKVVSSALQLKKSFP